MIVSSYKNIKCNKKKLAIAFFSKRASFTSFIKIKLILNIGSTHTSPEKYGVSID